MFKMVIASLWGEVRLRAYCSSYLSPYQVITSECFSPKAEVTLITNAVNATSMPQIVH